MYYRPRLQLVAWRNVYWQRWGLGAPLPRPVASNCSGQALPIANCRQLSVPCIPTESVALNSQGYYQHTPYFKAIYFLVPHLQFSAHFLVYLLMHCCWLANFCTYSFNSNILHSQIQIWHSHIRIWHSLIQISKMLPKQAFSVLKKTSISTLNPYQLNLSIQIPTETPISPHLPPQVHCHLFATKSQWNNTTLVWDCYWNNSTLH